MTARRHLFARIDSGLLVVEKAVSYVAGAGILVLMLAGCFEVFSRKLMNHPITGVADIIEATMVAVALLGMAYCQRELGNVRMTLITATFKGRLAHLADLFSFVVGAVFVTLVLVGAWTYAKNFLQLGGTSPQLGLPLWIVAAIVPISMVLLLARLLLQSVATARLVIWPDATPEGLYIQKTDYQTEAI